VVTTAVVVFAYFAGAGASPAVALPSEPLLWFDSETLYNVGEDPVSIKDVAFGDGNLSQRGRDLTGNPDCFEVELMPWGDGCTLHVDGTGTLIVLTWEWPWPIELQLGDDPTPMPTPTPTPDTHPNADADRHPDTNANRDADGNPDAGVDAGAGRPSASNRPDALVDGRAADRCQRERSGTGHR